MIDIVDAALIVHPTVEPVLFVDDLSAEKVGEEDEIVKELRGLTLIVMARIHADGMEVSRVNSMISASRPSIAAKMVARLGKGCTHRESASPQLRCWIGCWHSPEHAGPTRSQQKL